MINFNLSWNVNIEVYVNLTDYYNVLEILDIYNFFIYFPWLRVIFLIGVRFCKPTTYGFPLSPDLDNLHYRDYMDTLNIYIYTCISTSIFSLATDGEGLVGRGSELARADPSPRGEGESAEPEHEGDSDRSCDRLKGQIVLLFKLGSY